MAKLFALQRRKLVLESMKQHAQRGGLLSVVFCIFLVTMATTPASRIGSDGSKLASRALLENEKSKATVTSPVQLSERRASLENSGVEPNKNATLDPQSESAQPAARSSPSNEASATAGAAVWPALQPAPKPKPRIMTVVSRFADDISWLTNNATGPGLASLMEIVVYQGANIDPAGFPTFPGLPQFGAPNQPLPVWPRWAQTYIAEKLRTRAGAEPGSVYDAVRMAKLIAAQAEAEAAALQTGNTTTVNATANLVDGSSTSSAAQSSGSSLGSSSSLNTIIDINTDDPSTTTSTTSAGLITIDTHPMDVIDNSSSEWVPPDTAAQREAGEGKSKSPTEWLRSWFPRALIVIPDRSNQESTKASNALQGGQSNGGDGTSEENDSFGPDWVKPSEIVIAPEVSRLPLHIVPNRGGEAMGYLSAIIDNYHNLPDLMLFVHGHEMSWHTFPFGQEWALAHIARKPPTNITKGHMQLACNEHHNGANQMWPQVIDANWESPNGPRWHESMAAHFAQAWHEKLGKALGLPLPYHIKAACCATFIATKEAIQNRNLEFYVSIRDWLLESPMERYWQGVILEFTWHIMFTNQTVYDPPQGQCLCELYDWCIVQPA